MSDPLHTSPDPLGPTVPQAVRPWDEPNFGPPAHPGEVGTLGRYRVLKKLGQGGMGAVYLGFHDALARKVALKVMLPAHAVNPDSRERFLREARLAARVKSDHVVTIHDVDESGGIPFIAMEHLHGAPLDQFLQTKGELPLDQVLRIGRETALGLAAAHALGLIHRDIKPGNVWLEAPKGRVKILDFGLARAQSETDLTNTGAVMGTPAYMSPEQARGAKVDARTDLFSLGVVLYRLCTGKMPFIGDDIMAVLTSLAVDTPPAPCALNPYLPAAVEAIVVKLLAKSPGERFQSAQEVADALQAVATGLLPTVVAQTQNARDGIDDSHSVAVPLDDTETTAEVAPPLKPATSKAPLLVVAAALLAMGTAAAVVLWPKKPAVAPLPDAARSVPSSEPPALPKEGASDRRAAERVLELGGRVRIGPSGTEFSGGAPERLPDGPLTVTEVYLADRPLTAGDAALLGGCRELVRVELERVGLTDAALAHLAACSKLKQVNLVDNPITDAGLKHLRGLGLTHLGVSGCDVTDAGLVPLVGRGLRRICVNDTRAGNGTLAELAGWDGEHLRLARTAITNDGLKHLRGASTVWLDLNGSAVTDDGLKHLEQMNGIRQLSLYCTGVTVAGAARVRDKFPTCDIRWFADPDRAAVDYILWWGAEVNVSGTDRSIKTRDAMPPGPFVLLAVRSRNNPLLADTDLAPFDRCDHLQTLDLRDSPVTDTHLRRFRHAKTIGYLLLDNTKTSDVGLAHFKNCKNLEHLSLAGTQVTDAGLAHFKGCPLKSLSVRGSKVTPQAALDFRRQHPQCLIDVLDMKK